MSNLQHCGPGNGGGGMRLQLRHEAERSLQLLKMIESTLENITGVAEFLSGIEAGARSLLKKLVASKANGELDANDEFAGILDSAQEACERLLEHYEACAESARADQRLTDDDGVAEAYDQACHALRGTHEALGELLFFVRQHDGLVSSSAGGPFQSADELIRFLRS